MAPYIGIPPTGIVAWNRHWPLQGNFNSGIGGAPIVAYNALGAPDPTALRFTTPIAGTTGLSFNSLVDNPTRSPYLALDDALLARTGEISIAFIAMAYNAGRSSGSFFRYGLDPAIRPWAAEADNDLYRFEWDRHSGGAFSMMNARYGHMTGPVPTNIVRQTSIGIDEAEPALYTFYRGAGPSPVMEATINGAVILDTSDEWPGDIGPSTITPLVSPTGGTSPDCRFFLGENFNGTFISPAVLFGKLTGATGKGVGGICDGQIRDLWLATLAPYYGGRR